MSLWGIRWPFCAYSFLRKNATPVAARVSFGSWEAGDLSRCKSAAVAEPRSHQVHGHCACYVLRRVPKLPPFPGSPRITYTPLRSALLPFTAWPPIGGLHVSKSCALINYFCWEWIYSERVKKMQQIIVGHHCRLRNYKLCISPVNVKKLCMRILPSASFITTGEKQAILRYNPPVPMYLK